MYRTPTSGVTYWWDGREGLPRLTPLRQECLSYCLVAEDQAAGDVVGEDVGVEHDDGADDGG
jgi:hypothetical protein